MVSVRDKVAMRMKYKVGNGENIATCFDNRHSTGLLINQITNRELSEARIPKMKLPGNSRKFSRAKILLLTFSRAKKNISYIFTLKDTITKLFMREETYIFMLFFLKIIHIELKSQISNIMTLEL